ncbi:tetratricopeptide repeat protein [Pseudoalteromonas fenneropenaei]|uniref:Tetratricopeptide repeat protein n=1 Tax=Pseudoalteromonas fenneropenaei TaxID=1737459 RepID=A0ABV7CGR2_9GAMM
MSESQLTQLPSSLKAAITLYQSNDFTAAERQFTLLLEDESCELVARCFLAEIALIAGTGKEHIAALKAFLESQPFASEVKHLLGLCYQQKRELSAAVSCYRDALATLLQHPPTIPYKQPVAAEFDTTIHETLLWQTLVALRQAGVKSFATSGSLLGIEREGRILANDKDIDIGVDWGQMSQAIGVLQALGWQEYRRSYDLVNPRCFIHAAGVTLDLCGFAVDARTQTTIAGIWMSEMPFSWNRVTEYPAIHLTDKRTPFGMVWHLQQPQQFLTALYGDWQTPQPLFDTVLCARNIRDFSLLTQCLLYARLYRLVLLRQWAKLRFTLANVAFLDKQDSLIRALEQLAQSQEHAV